MPKTGYSHVTRDQRCQIYALKSRGYSNTEIARSIRVHPSTISREIKRNSGQRGYRFDQADRLSKERRSAASQKPKKLINKVCQAIKIGLQQKWSPEQTAGRLKIEGVCSISHETIYQFVWRDKRAGGTLYNHLRHRAKPYNRRGNKTAGRGCIPNRVDIDQRPPIVDTKCRVGDLELDTIIGKNHKAAIVSIVDKKTKKTWLKKVDEKTSDQVNSAIIEKLKRSSRKLFTVTFDNGKEFARHEELAAALGVKCYFAKPYHSWERGLNEHTNGLVRQYIPKGTDFRKLTDQAVQYVEDQLNLRPRKSLNYKTPNEVFYKTAIPFLSTVALRC